MTANKDTAREAAAQVFKIAGVDYGSPHSQRLPTPVNDHDREVKLPEENPTIGLLLCKSAKKTVVELTLPNVRQHHAKEPERSADSQPRAARRASAARQYQLYLPSKELLKQKLDEWSAIETR